MRLFRFAIAGIVAGTLAELLYGFSPVSAAPKASARTGGGTGKAASARSVNAARRGTGANRNVQNTAGNSLVLSGKFASGGRKKRCRDTYVECMDLQIPGIIGRYSYLDNDKAVEIMSEGVDPFRCVYYNSRNVEKLFGVNSGQVSKNNNTLADRTLAKFCTPAQLKEVKDGKAKDGTNFCWAQRDMNELYMLYNYYCKISEEPGPAGLPVNMCVMKESDGTKKSSSFASKSSRAFFEEALSRLKKGTLKILNLDQTDFYKNRILPMISCDQLDYPANKADGTALYANKAACESSTTEKRLENWKMYSLSSSEMTNIFEGLGLDNENEIFSINVAPPSGAGSLDSASIFVRSSDLCFSGTSLSKANLELFSDKAKLLQEHVNDLKHCTETESRSALERYYLAGTWVKECDDGYLFNSASNKCVSSDDPNDKVDPYSSQDLDSGAPLVESDFLSAKRSCGLFEQTLITTRDQSFGDFDTLFKSFIYDNVAKLISKQSDDMALIGDALNSLIELDAQTSINMSEWDAKKYESKAQSMTRKEQAKADFESAMADMMIESGAARKRLYAVFGDQYSASMVNSCSEMARSFSEVNLTNYGDFVSTRVSVRYSDGDIIPSLTSNSSDKVDSSSSISGTGSGSGTQKTLYKSKTFSDQSSNIERGNVACIDIPGFDFTGLMPAASEFADCTDILHSSGGLSAGIYKILLTGAGGGGGGRSYGGLAGGYGGNGEKASYIFTSAKDSKYTLTLGDGGKGGIGATGKAAGDGKPGGDTIFQLGDQKYTAKGGKGGGGSPGGQKLVAVTTTDQTNVSKAGEVGGMAVPGNDGGPNHVWTPGKIVGLRNDAYGFPAYKFVTETDYDKCEQYASSCSGYTCGTNGDECCQTQGACTKYGTKQVKTEGITFDKNKITAETFTKYMMEMNGQGYYGIGGMGNPGLRGTWVTKYLVEDVKCSSGSGTTNHDCEKYMREATEEHKDEEFCSSDDMACNSFRTGEQGKHGYAQLLCLKGLNADADARTFTTEDDLTDYSSKKYTYNLNNPSSYDLGD